MKRAGLLATLTLLALGAPTAAHAEGPALPHFALSKSSPEAGSTVKAPDEVRLWFSQVPQEGTTSIRLLNAAEELIHTSDVAQSSDDPKSFAVSLHAPLPPGAYTVVWRAMGADGHVVRGDFSFTVSAD